jgi:hypothetical protein
VKTLVGLKIFVDFVRFNEQLFVGETNCAVISNRQKIVGYKYNNSFQEVIHFDQSYHDDFLEASDVSLKNLR